MNRLVICKFSFLNGTAWLLVIAILLIHCRNEPDQQSTQVQIQTSVENVVELPLAAPVHFDYDTSVWIEILNQGPFHLDMRYASDRNFTHRSIYPCGRCFLRKEAGLALLGLRDTLLRHRLGIVLWDCYRPIKAQQLLWDAFPNATYLTPPGKGSMHSRGLAVDLGLQDEDGRLLDLGSDFDHFGPEAHRDYQPLSEPIRMRRAQLDAWMQKAGFGGIRTEWWHYSYRKAFTVTESFEWPCTNDTE